MSKLNGIRLRLGKTQRLIVEHLLECGGATSKLDLEAFAALFSIKCRCVNRAAWWLEKRGVLKRVSRIGRKGRYECLAISDREFSAWLDATSWYPQAREFWVLTDAAMDVIGESG